MIDIELDYALNDLAIAMDLDKELEPNDLAIVEDIKEEEEGDLDDDYFNLYPTKEEIAYYNNLVDDPRPPFVKIDPKIERGNPRNVKIPCMIGYKYMDQAYIDFESSIKIMSSSVYNDIVKTRLEPRRDLKYPGGVCKFVGRIKGLHVFVGNFTNIVDFMVVEDLANVIDFRLSHVVLGKPFIEDSKLKHDRIEGTVQFSNEFDRITYRMPNKMKEFRYVPKLDMDNISAIEDINEEDKNKGMNFIWEKRSRYYKNCLTLGPKYRVDMEIVQRLRESIEKWERKT